MKIAIDHSGKQIAPSADAPAEALCPYCKRPVILRQRRRSSKPGDITYFWRHEDGIVTNCPGRFKVFNTSRLRGAGS